MKKIRTIRNILLIILINLIFLNPISLISGYPDNGDCKDYHKVVYIIPYYEKDASIKLDGVPNEIFWNQHSNEQENGSLTIPLASEGIWPNISIVYLNITFVRTNQYLYVLCKWFDNSTRPSLSNNLYDGLYFCWNINVPNFSAYFSNGMSTLEMGGGDVDSWDWSCLSTSPPNSTSYFCKDKCFGTYGWYDPSLETEDVKIGYSYRTNISYTLEIMRRLSTNDQYDIQFDRTNKYLFNMGIMNDGTHEDHLISWTYALDLRFTTQSESISSYNIIIIIIISLFTISLLLFNRFSKSKIKFIEK